MNWAKENTSLFREARRVFGVDITYNAATYRGVQVETSELLPVMSGGFPQDYSGAVDVLTDELSPAIGDKLTINGVTYRVEHKSSSAEDPVTRLFLQGVSK